MLAFAFRPGGVNVELKGDDLYINGRLKYGEKPSLLTRFVTVPRCVSKKSVTCADLGRSPVVLPL